MNSAEQDVIANQSETILSQQRQSEVQSEIIGSQQEESKTKTEAILTLTKENAHLRDLLASPERPTRPLSQVTSNVPTDVPSNGSNVSSKGSNGSNRSNAPSNGDGGSNVLTDVPTNGGSNVPNAPSNGLNGSNAPSNGDGGSKVPTDVPNNGGSNEGGSNVTNGLFNAGVQTPKDVLKDGEVVKVVTTHNTHGGQVGVLNLNARTKKGIVQVSFDDGTSKNMKLTSLILQRAHLSFEDEERVKFILPDDPYHEREGTVVLEHTTDEYVCVQLEEKMHYFQKDYLEHLDW